MPWIDSAHRAFKQLLALQQVLTGVAFVLRSLPLDLTCICMLYNYLYLSLYTSLSFSFSTLPFWSDFTSYISCIQFWIFCCPSAQFHFTSLALSCLDALVRFMATYHFYTNLFTFHLTVPYECTVLNRSGGIACGIAAGVESMTHSTLEPATPVSMGEREGCVWVFVEYLYLYLRICIWVFVFEYLLSICICIWESVFEYLLSICICVFVFEYL